jgi:hypothetical protein
LNLAALRDYVRDLTGVYATDLVPDTLLTRWLNEAYLELARTQKWSWLPVTELATNTDVPAFESQFHAILAYRTAIKVLGTQADDTTRGELYGNEYTALYEAMVLHYFPKNATGSVGNRGQLRQQVRDLSGVHNDAVSDSLINQWLDEAYNEIARARDWDWLELTQEFNVTGVGPYNLTNGTRRVIAAHLMDERGIVEEVFERPDTVNLNSNRRLAYYDVTPAGVFTLAPEERFDGTEILTLRVRYTRSLVNFASDSSTPSFAAQFNPILAYMVAVKVLGYTGSEEEARIGLFSGSAATLFEDMVAFYELSHDSTAFQMGAEGRELQQYPYWFRRF